MLTRPTVAGAETARASRGPMGCRTPATPPTYPVATPVGVRKEISGVRFTAKTFRTWLSSVQLLAALRGVDAATTLSRRKRQLNEALQSVADQLGNTPAICRKSYMHPALIDAFLSDELGLGSRQKRAGLSSAECDLVAVLQGLQQQRAAA